MPRNLTLEQVEMYLFVVQLKNALDIIPNHDPEVPSLEEDSEYFDLVRKLYTYYQRKASEFFKTI
jgi:hypothetical protein